MKKPWYIITIILFLEIIVIFLLVPGDHTERVIIEENKLIEKYLSNNSAVWVKDNAARWYQTTMIDSGVYEAMYRHLIPNDNEKANSRGMQEMGRGLFQWVIGRLEAFTNIIYQFLSRLALFILWSPYILIFFIPAIYDGLMMREIKKTNFALASPIVHRYSLRAVLFLIFLLFTIFFLPIAMNPLIIPFVMLGICIFASFTLSNFQKRI